jgi:hypothetical protein
MSKIDIKSGSNNDEMTEPTFEDSNLNYDREVQDSVPEKPIKRKLESILESNVTTGSYQDLPKKPRKWNASNFKVTKQSKAILDEKTEEGKYQRKMEELAKRRETCTEICFKTFSDAEVFKENMEVNIKNTNKF